MTTADGRPRAVLALWDGVAEVAFLPDQLERLGELVELVHDGPIGSFSDVPPATLADVEVLVGHWGCPRLDDDALDLLPELRLFAYAAGSVKEGGTVTPGVFERGVTVTTAAAANARPVAEYTLAVILLANKGAFGAWVDPVGNCDKRIGIFGASRTGRLLIELLRPFDLTPVVYDPYLSPDDATALGVELLDLPDLLRTCDVVTIHAPLTPETDGLVGAAQLAAMKDGAVLVNTARGRLVDTAALERELSTGRISAVLDVTWPEPLDPDSVLLRLPNAFVTPHVAGSMGTELRRLADAAIDEVARFVSGEPPAHAIRPDEFDRLA